MSDGCAASGPCVFTCATQSASSPIAGAVENTVQDWVGNASQGTSGTAECGPWIQVSTGQPAAVGAGRVACSGQDSELFASQLFRYRRGFVETPADASGRVRLSHTIPECGCKDAHVGAVAPRTGVSLAMGRKPGHRREFRKPVLRWRLSSKSTEKTSKNTSTPTGECWPFFKNEFSERFPVRFALCGIRSVSAEEVDDS